jgi:pyruvate dehydrogenase E1 component alpha subunit
MKKCTLDQLIAFEKRVEEAFKRGEVNCPIHLSGGNEEQLIRIFEKINEDDYVFSTHRNHYHYLLKGGCPEKLFDEILGKPTGCCGGKGRSMHIFDNDIKFYTSAIIGGTCGIATGVALGIKANHGTNKVWCFVGDGAVDNGWFWEAVRYAYCRELPLTFIVEDNDLAVESTYEDRWRRRITIETPHFSAGELIVEYYQYTRKYPHVGVGERVSL